MSFSIMIFVWYIPSCGVAGPYGRFIPSFLRNPHTVLHKAVSILILHSHQQWRVPFSPHLLQHLLFEDFFDDGHSAWCKAIPHYTFDLHVPNN